MQKMPFPMAGRYMIAIDGIVCPDGGEGAGGLPLQLHTDPSPDSFGQPTGTYAQLEGTTTYLSAKLTYSFLGC